MEGMSSLKSWEWAVFWYCKLAGHQKNIQDQSAADGRQSAEERIDHLHPPVNPRGRYLQIFRHHGAITISKSEEYFMNMEYEGKQQQRKNVQNLLLSLNCKHKCIIKKNGWRERTSPQPGCSSLTPHTCLSYNMHKGSLFRYMWDWGNVLRLISQPVSTTESLHPNPCTLKMNQYIFVILKDDKSLHPSA